MRNENYDDTSDRGSQEEKKELEKQPVRSEILHNKGAHKIIRLEGSWITYEHARTQHSTNLGTPF